MLSVSNIGAERPAAVWATFSMQHAGHNQLQREAEGLISIRFQVNHTAMPQPPGLEVGRNYEGSLTPAACS